MTLVIHGPSISKFPPMPQILSGAENRIQKFSKLDQLRRSGADRLGDRDVRLSMNRRFRSKSVGLNGVVSALQRNGHRTFLTATKEWTLRRSRMTGTADMDSTILTSLASAIGILLGGFFCLTGEG